MTASDFAELEKKFAVFERDTSKSLYFSIRDYHYEIRESQIEVRIGARIGVPTK